VYSYIHSLRVPWCNNGVSHRDHGVHDCKLLNFPDEISRIIDAKNVKILRCKQNSNVIERFLWLYSEVRTKVCMTIIYDQDI
jgi:hypothetical protein